MPVLAQPDYYPALLQIISEQLLTNTVVEWAGKIYEILALEVEPDDLHLLQIAVTSRDRLPTSLERAVHAQCLEWFAIADPDLADQLHEPETSPLSLGLKYVSPRQIHIRIGLLQQHLLAPLLWGMSSDLGQQITLANASCKLSRQVKLLATERFKQLTQIEGADRFAMRFYSPTSFKQGKVVIPFPLPELVFTNLHKRWNTFAPSALQLPDVEWQGMVSEYQLTTEVLHLRGGVEIGFQGWTKYRFPDPQQAQLAIALAHFAAFSGVGRKTAMGMGQAHYKK